MGELVKKFIDGLGGKDRGDVGCTREKAVGRSQVRCSFKSENSRLVRDRVRLSANDALLPNFVVVLSLHHSSICHSQN